jgi:radical SAM/Cys-rich protein
MLNEVGYGKEGTGLKLNLVYNPAGCFLPGDQVGLEREFKKKLKSEFNIDFNSLYCITNMPISRYLEYLVKSGNYDSYMTTLVNAFNPQAAASVMCRNTLSIGWDGQIYDCDFNQMLDLPVATSSRHIKDFDLKILQSRNIVIGQHCYGCTAGSGSSCGGAVV